MDTDPRRTNMEPAPPAVTGWGSEPAGVPGSRREPGAASASAAPSGADVQTGGPGRMASPDQAAGAEAAAPLAASAPGHAGRETADQKLDARVRSSLDLGRGSGDSTAPLAPGRVVFDRFELRQLLGRGGMGLVYLAQDLKLDRPVAMKFLSDLVCLDVAAIDDLKRETRRGLELTHSNMVRVYDFIEDTEGAAITMEYVDGRNMAQLRVSRPSRVFEATELRQLVWQWLDAIAYAHAMEVIHRDLKPGNLIVTAGGFLKVGDFGIARCLSESLARQTSYASGPGGTLIYMSPQQAFGELPTETDDIYSIGATLYELFTGKPPFYGGDISRQLQEKVPPSMARRRRELRVESDIGIPDIWEQAVAACLAKDPAGRPANVRELAGWLGMELRSWLPGGKLSGDVPRTARVTVKAELGAVPSPQAPVEAAPAAHASVVRTPERSAAGSGSGWGLAAVGMALAGLVWWLAPDPAMVSVEQTEDRLETDGPGAALVVNHGDDAPDRATRHGQTDAPPTAATALAAEASDGSPAEPAPEATAPAGGPLPVEVRPGADGIATSHQAGEANGPGYLHTDRYPGFQWEPMASTLLLQAVGSDPDDFGWSPDPGFGWGSPPAAAGPDGTTGLRPAAIHPPADPPSTHEADLHGGEPEPAPEPGESQPNVTELWTLLGRAEVGAAIKVAAIEAHLEQHTGRDDGDSAEPEWRQTLEQQLLHWREAAERETPHQPWNIDQLFAGTPYASYSEAGRRRILHEAQQQLGEAGLYHKRADGLEGPATHQSLVSFQSDNRLVADGRLNQATLAALGLDSEPDDEAFPFTRPRATSAASHQRSASHADVPRRALPPAPGPPPTHEGYSWFRKTFFSDSIPGR